MFVSCECCVLSGRSLCDELITRQEESTRLLCVVVFDLETSWMRRLWPALGHSTKKKKCAFFGVVNDYVPSCSECLWNLWIGFGGGAHRAPTRTEYRLRFYVTFLCTATNAIFATCAAYQIFRFLPSLEYWRGNAVLCSWVISTRCLCNLTTSARTAARAHTHTHTHNRNLRFMNIKSIVYDFSQISIRAPSCTFV